jgi:hypothetical protein
MARSSSERVVAPHAVCLAVALSLTVAWCATTVHASGDSVGSVCIDKSGSFSLKREIDPLCAAYGALKNGTVGGESQSGHVSDD